MKVIVDLDRLFQDGVIDEAAYQDIRQRSAYGTNDLAVNLITAFGICAVVLSALVLVPAATTAIVIGVMIGAGGCGALYARHKPSEVIAKVAVAVGALLFAGGLITLDEGSIRSFLVVAAVLGAGGVIGRSRLLTVLAVLSLSSCLGVRTGYFHATYFLGIQEPTAVVVLFSIFSIAFHQLGKRLDPGYQKITTAASRTGVFLVNFGFWIGSLWGDHLSYIEVGVPGWSFSVLWAVALIATGCWAWRCDRKWLVNVVAVFGGIHFYTQWFENLQASATTVLLAGLIAIALGVGLRTLNVNWSKSDG